jgi:hemoglobin
MSAEMPTDEDSLFDRLGGVTGVAEIVNEMYQRVLDDPELAPFFENVAMERLRRMQYQFIASALDGPVEYTGTELNAIHRGRGITAHHFAKFCGHFADAMEAHGAEKHDLDQALGRLATYKDEITGETNLDG